MEIDYWAKLKKLEQQRKKEEEERDRFCGGLAGIGMLLWLMFPEAMFVISMTGLFVLLGIATFCNFYAGAKNVFNYFKT